MPSVGELKRRTLEGIAKPSYSIYGKGMVLLNDNCGLFGANPAVEEVAETFDFARLWEYPSESSVDLRTRIASEFSVEPEEVIVGNGSDEILDIVSKCFLNPDDVFCSPAPTFGMYKFYARLNFATIVEKVLRKDFSMDPDELIGERAKLMAICQPNNPTGNLFDPGAVRKVLSESEGAVILDEAYADFCGSNMLADSLNSDRAIDVRTFSKAMGMAGLRIGYGIARREMIDELRHVRTPFGLNSFSEAVAVKALDNKAWVKDVVGKVKASKAYLAPKLADLGFKVYPSDTSFLIARCPVPGPALVSALKSEGVAIRDLNGAPLLENHIRVTMAPTPMLDILLEKLEHLLGGK